MISYGMNSLSMRWMTVKLQSLMPICNSSVLNSEKVDPFMAGEIEKWIKDQPLKSGGTNSRLCDSKG